MIKINLSKKGIQELKTIEKFKTKDDARNMQNLIYNGNMKRFEVTNGKIAIMINYELPEITDPINYSVTILTDCIILEKFNGFPDIERIIKNNNITNHTDIELELLGKTSEKNIKISVFVNKAPIAYNIEYLQKLPAAKYKLSVCSRSDYIKHSPALLKGNCELGLITVLLMPCITY